MVLNPFARRRSGDEAASADSEAPASRDGSTAEQNATPEPPARPSRSRRGSRSGRRTRASKDQDAGEPAPDEERDKAKASPPEGAKSTRRTSSRSRRKGSATTAAEPEAASGAEEKKSEPRGRRQSRTAAAQEAEIAALAKAIEKQAKQLEELRKALLARKDEKDDRSISEQRVGVFIDAANAEKGREEKRVKIDWGKVLERLTAGRRLARAIAYAPISDDPAVSIETQRFVEPFLDCGYRVVTKPLKRFQGGAIKANLDIEIALDIMGMLDRLDVVCLVSGDGDFEPLVEAVQARGVRVEVASFLHNTAANLRNAADQFIDLSHMHS